MARPEKLSTKRKGCCNYSHDEEVSGAETNPLIGNSKFNNSRDLFDLSKAVDEDLLSMNFVKYKKTNSINNKISELQQNQNQNFNQNYKIIKKCSRKKDRSSVNIKKSSVSPDKLVLKEKSGNRKNYRSPNKSKEVN